ncbi:MAG: hypothetical protein ACOYT7_02010 [Patescibacteria group bacterium]
MDEEDLVEMGIEGKREKIEDLMLVAGIGVLVILVIAIKVALAIFGTPISFLPTK